MTKSPSHEARDSLIKKWLTDVAGTKDLHKSRSDSNARLEDRNATRRTPSPLRKRWKVKEVHQSDTSELRHVGGAAPGDQFGRIPPPDIDIRSQEQHPHLSEKRTGCSNLRNSALLDHEVHLGPSLQLTVDASEKYGRRKRHKTRENRYDYNANHSTADTKRESRAKEKRKSHRKSGNSLHKDFKAPNVESERLTLKQEALPGIFSKGKASGPTERRGIPDLTFSEMSFLNNKRPLDEARLRGLQTMTHSGNKRKGDAEDVSAFFSQEDPNEHEHRSGLHDLKEPAIGPAPVQVFERGVWRETDRNQEYGKAETKLSSHVTWSTSPERPQVALTPHCRISARRERPIPSTSNVQRQSHSQVPSVNPHSSASQPSQHFDNPYLSGKVSKRRYYTLEDLMQLAGKAPGQEPERQDSGDVCTEYDSEVPAPLEGLPRPHCMEHPSARSVLFRPGLAWPDPDLMPRRDLSFRIDRSQGSSSHHETTGPPRLEPLEIQHVPDREHTVSRREILELEALYERSDSNIPLDKFDQDLLDNSTVQQACSDFYGTNVDTTPTALPSPLADSTLKKSAATGVSLPSKSLVESPMAVPQRPQLLRPSQDEPNIMSPFTPFSRPRLLY